MGRAERLDARDAAALAVLAALVLYFFRAPLVEGATLYFRDFQIFFAPMKAWLVEAYRQGTLPFWDPRLHNGLPFFADIQSGVLYPPSLLLLAGDADRGMAVFIAFHLLLAGAGAHGFARTLGLGAAAALAAALAFTLGGWMASAINMLNLMQTAAWAPLVLWAFGRLWAAPSPRRLALAAAACALQILAGLPEIVIMTGLLVLARRLAMHGRGRLAGLALLAGAYALAALVAAPQLLATWEALGVSTRAAGLPPAEILRFSTDWSALATLLFPPPLAASDWDILAAYPSGHVPLLLSLYLGFGVLTLVALALLQPGRETAFWLALAAAGLFLALGRHNPLAPPLLRLLPMFRSPEKYAFLLHLGLAMLAGLGLQVLVASLAARARWRALIALPPLALVAAELLWVNGDINLIGAPGYYRLDDLPETALLARRPGPVYARGHVRADITRVAPLYRSYRDGLSANLGATAGIDYVNGTAFIVLADHDLQHYLLDGLPPGRELARRLAFFGARYVLSSDPALAASAAWRDHATPLTARLWALEGTPPPAYFPARVSVAPADFIHQAIATPEYADGRAAFVSAGSPGEDLAGQVTSLARGVNGARLAVSTATGGLLVWRQNWYPGWRAHVDGRPAEVLRANHFFLGVRVPPGAREVRFDFEPTHWRIGIALAGAALLAGLGLVLARRRW